MHECNLFEATFSDLDQNDWSTDCGRHTGIGTEASDHPSLGVSDNWHYTSPKTEGRWIVLQPADLIGKGKAPGRPGTSFTSPEACREWLWESSKNDGSSNCQIGIMISEKVKCRMKISIHFTMGKSSKSFYKYVYIYIYYPDMQIKLCLCVTFSGWFWRHLEDF